jgi:hypothetical protein
LCFAPKCFLLQSHDRRVLARMVEPDASKRYATAREVVDDLERKPKPVSVSSTRARRRHVKNRASGTSGGTWPRSFSASSR